jgi:hypothetical protein
MTSRLVVPTLAGAPPQNQSLERFWAASCETRVMHGRIEFAGASKEELNNSELVRKLYLGC